MKNTALIIFALFMLFSVQLMAQNNDEKLSRKEKKELRKKEEEKTKLEISKLLESRKFVFEADQIIDREGKTYLANSSINFISIDSNKAVFQLGSAATIGVNGVGGITIEGDITDFKLEKNEKNGYYYLILKVAAKTGFYEIQLDISPLGTTKARITTSDYRKVNYSGSIVSFKQSIIYKGVTY